jgi:hypothetical protein
MRRLGIASLAVGLFLAGGVRAQDDVWPIIDKAIKAHGGANKLNKQTAMQVKSKGTLDLFGGIEFTQDMSAYAGKFKDVMQMQVNGQNITVTTVYDGSKSWISANGMDVDLGEKVQDEIKQAVHVMGLARLTVLKDKKYRLGGLGESQVEGKPAVGVKVVLDGFKDVNLYFDKASGLLVKVERQALDSQSMQEVSEERIIQEYQEVEGTKAPKRILVNREGKKFLEAEVLEVKLLDKLDDSEFAKP